MSDTITKETLKGYVDLKREIALIRHRIEQLEAEMTSPGIQNITGMPIYHSGNNDRMANYVAKMQDLQDQYQKKLTKLLELENQIETAVDSLSGLHRVLVHMRYIEGKKWEEICVDLNYSWRQVHRLHGDALEQLREVCNKMAHNGTLRCATMVLSEDTESCTG